jgi:4-amino-4-deoxy-L-arabinose transferase-like glycosyltransferase
MQKDNKSRFLLMSGVILLAILWRMSFVAGNVLPFDGDEAIVGLMAKHILGGERPLFFYGQYYMGSLNAYLIALGFLVLGQKVWVMRLIQALLFGATVYCVIKIGEEAFKNLKAGLLAGLLLAIPNVNLLLYSTASLGGYGEALFFSALILLISLRLKNNLITDSLKPSKVFFLSLFLGMASGIGFWANSLSAVFSFPCIVFVLIFLSRSTIPRRKKWNILLICAAGFLLGLAPYWIAFIQNGFGNVISDLARNINIQENGSVVQKIVNHIFTYFFLGLPALLGMRAAWDVRWLAIPVLPFLICTYAAILLWRTTRSVQKSINHDLYPLITGIWIFFFVVFVFTPFGLDPSGRYFMPLNIILSLVTANFVVSIDFKKWLASGAAAIILIFNLWGTLQCALKNPPGITLHLDPTNRIDHRADPDLITFLSDHGIHAGYSTYWVSYPLAFLSDEKLVFLPLLPYHTSMEWTPRDDRYKPYDAIVEQAKNIGYITVRFPELDDRLRSGFEGLHVTWEEETIGDYRVFFNLSQMVTPTELGFEIQ